MSRSLRAFGARARHGAMRTLLIAGAASVSTGIALTACSNASNQSTAGSGGGGAPLAAPAPSGERHAFSASGSSGNLANLVLSAQRIIYTANLSIRVSASESVVSAADRASGIVAAVGGYVSGEEEIIPPGSREAPQIDLTLKIPVAQYRPTLAKLAALGTQISFSQHAQDVTQQVADVNSRVASAQAAIKQLRALLKKAGSVGQLLAVQEEINTQESDLEALLAQQRALAHETSYATVTAVLVGHHERPVTKHKKTSPGFLAGLRGGWHALVVVVGWLLTALGSALPFLIPVLLVAGIAIGGRRRLARRKTPPTAEPPAPAAP